MSLGRSNSIYNAKKTLPQIIETKRTPLATSPIINQLKNDEKNKHNLSITDCSCPICLEVLIEPVVLPCKHELCLPCFKDMMDQTNFLCPMVIIIRFKTKLNQTINTFYFLSVVCVYLHGLVVLLNTMHSLIKNAGLKFKEISALKSVIEWKVKQLNF